MKINFFNSQELMKMNKKIKIVFLCLINSFLLFAISLTLLIVFATYQNKTLIVIIGTFVLTLLLWIIIYLLFFINRANKNRYLYEQIFNGKVTTLEGVIVYVGNYSITVMNSPKVFEIRLKVNDCVFNLYLLDCFDKSLFVLDNNISVEVVSEYIRGVTVYEK